MAFMDLGKWVRIENETREDAHLQVTQTTTRWHMDADDAEENGDRQLASDLRMAAESVQTSANKRWRPRSN